MCILITRGVALFAAALLTLGGTAYADHQVDWRDYPLCEQYYPMVEALFGDETEIAMDVMAAESGCDKDEKGPNGYGLFQFTSIAVRELGPDYLGFLPWTERAQLLPPQRNIFAAWLLCHHGRPTSMGWKHWTPCSDGRAFCG